MPHAALPCFTQQSSAAAQLKTRLVNQIKVALSALADRGRLLASAVQDIEGFVRRRLPDVKQAETLMPPMLGKLHPL